MKIYDHKYMSYELKEDRIDFIWHAETENMTDYKFQYSILRYASYVMEYKIKKVLIDLTNFKFNPSNNSGQFHADYVTRIYNMVGVKRKVFIAPFMDSKIIGKESGTDYENAFMHSYDSGVLWLNEKG